MLISTAVTQDLFEVLKLLKLVNLPIEGIEEHFSNFFVIRKDNLIIGCVGIELYKNVGLLRSLAIHPAHQGQGLGRQLVRKIEQHSLEKGLDNIYLLTETAEKLFLTLGYRYVTREEVDLEIKQTIEFTTLCPSSPVMVKAIISN